MSNAAGEAMEDLAARIDALMRALHLPGALAIASCGRSWALGRRRCVS